VSILRNLGLAASFWESKKKKEITVVSRLLLGDVTAEITNGHPAERFTA
jgi:hypothetical protein